MQEAGIVVPVAVTAGVWSLVAPDNIEEMPCQSVEGRLWDLLWMFTCTPRQQGAAPLDDPFQVCVPHRQDHAQQMLLTEHQTETFRATRAG